MKIRLKNFKGIKAGPELTWDGMDEIEIDFTGKQGLLAFAGENGGGKSTLLENLHHYPQLVSRGGALWQHAMGREAEKEFISSFMGHEYRSVIKMDAEQGKQEGYLWIDGKPSVNGKISAYKEAVNEIFGQPFTYFRSQFCPQKSKTTQGMMLENMTAGVFRELLQQFLNLQRYAAWEDTSKQAGNILSGQIAGIDQRIAGLEETTGRGLFFSADKNLQELTLDGLLQQKESVTASLAERRAAVDTLKATIQKNALALERRKDIQAQIDRLNGELAKEKQTAEGEISTLGKKYHALKQEIMACDCTLQDWQKIETAAEAVQGLESGLTGLVAQIEEENQNVPVYQKRCHDIETQIAALRQNLKDLATDPENLRLGKIVEEAERAVKDKEQDLRDLNDSRELYNLDAQINNAKDMTKALDERGSTCPTPPPADCSFIAGAIRAAEILPDMETKRKNLLCTIAINRHVFEEAIEKIKTDTAVVLEEKGRRLDWIKQWNVDAAEEIKNATHDLKNAQQVLLSTTELLTAHRQDLARKRAEIAKQKALADCLPEIKVAEQRKADLEKQLAEVTTAGTARKAAWEAKAKEIDDTLQYHLGAKAAYVLDEGAETKLQGVLWDIKEIETVKIPAVENEIQTAREKIATLQAELTRIEAAEKELQDVKITRDSLTLKVSRWKYLQLGCGKTGLQNLRIDGAAPRIIFNANKLLSQAYGARYAVRLETQNEAGKEDLQIKIIMENGQEVYLDDISGGQRAWNVQALWLAMSLLNQEKSGRKYDYFCSDESDGALDTENAEKYTALYRPFCAEAGLSQLIYISHKESCRAMADHVLTFEHGKNPGWN